MTAVLNFLSPSNGGKSRVKGFDSPTELYPTRIAARFPEGVVRGVDNSVWLLGKVPLAPYRDARSLSDQLAAVESMMRVTQDLGALAVPTANRRMMSKGSYRNIQYLLVNVPEYYRPDPSSPIATKQTRDYGHRIVDRRMLFLAVQLKPTVMSSGLREAAESVVETMRFGGAPMSDFDKDRKLIGGILSRAGMVAPTSEEIRLADSWWSDQQRSDSHFALHPDHMHVFASSSSATLAKTHEKTPCAEWPSGTGHNVVSVASVEDFENLNFVESTKLFTQWVSDAVTQGALAVSIRAQVEPAKISAEEMRRQHSRIRNDIDEMVKAHKMTRHEQTRQLDLLRSISQAYETGGFPTLHDASVLVAFNGMKDETRLMQYSTAQVRLMEDRQLQGLTEMMLASEVRANPNRHELPSATVACSGITSLNRVGDRRGAVLGFDERDNQPAYVDSAAAYLGDALPLMVIVGATGSGKMTPLSTRVPTPSGRTTMGDLTRGDVVLGRDGKPCRVVHLSPVAEHPDAYRITLSDGQQITADGNHQFVASTRDDRVAMRNANHRKALTRANESRTLAQRIRNCAQTVSVGESATLVELLELLETVPGNRIHSKIGVRAVLDMMDTPREVKRRTHTRRFASDELVKKDPVNVYSAPEALAALADAWENPGNARWAARAARRARAAREVLATVGPDDRWTIRQMTDALDSIDPELAMCTVPTNASFRRSLAGLGVAGETEYRTVELTLPAKEIETEREALVFNTRRALTDVSRRVLQQITVDESAYLERVVSTAEMLAEGVDLPSGHKNWALHVAQPLDLPEADLPVAPYTLGAWLGDGTTANNQLTGIDPEIWRRIEQDGYAVWHDSRISKNHRIEGLRASLRRAGFAVKAYAADKHIPTAYLRASHAQRLELLQGLMDTDGTISKAGSAELCLTSKRLIDDALELIRSLGIKASITEGTAAYTMTDPDTGEATRRVTGTRYRIKFTTDQPVFHLPRKRALLPTALRETQQWLYVTAIEPVDPVPMRCITVDSADSTYLIEGMVPTHNTLVGLDLADQWQSAGSPNVFIDPKTHKKGEGHGPVVRNMGGDVASLDDLLTSDGVFDAVRFMTEPQAAVDQAVDLLLSINPWGSKKEDLEVPLSAALQYGIVDRGATCLGQALKIAYDDGKLTGHEDVYRKCEELKNSNALFGAMYGRDPQSEPLRVADGLTLIEVGSTHLPIPEAGSTASSLTQRVAMALVRMMVFGSANALTGRGGAVMLDEAWVFMSAGRAEMERLGRLARSQRVLPVLMTQRVTDATDAGLQGYISRGIILHIADHDEAKAACDLFKVEASPDRLGRIMASEKIGDEFESTGAEGLNPKSLKALTFTTPDPDFPGEHKRNVVRGSVGFYADLRGRFIPVENVLSEEFLLLASTNLTDIQRRERVLQSRRAERARRRRSALTYENSAGSVEELFPAGRGRSSESVFDARKTQAPGAPEPHRETPREKTSPVGAAAPGSDDAVEVDDVFR